MFQMWPELIRKSKEGGLDVIESYVFWNYHEPVRGQVLFWCFFVFIHVNVLDYSHLVTSYQHKLLGLIFH